METVTVAAAPQPSVTPTRRTKIYRIVRSSHRARPRHPDATSWVAINWMGEIACSGFACCGAPHMARAYSWPPCAAPGELQRRHFAAGRAGTKGAARRGAERDTMTRQDSLRRRNDESILGDVQPETSKLKMIAAALVAVAMLAGTVAEANAAACAAGVYHAGCVGPRGAAVVRKPAAVIPPAAVVAPRCVWRAGVRVCR